MNLGLVFPQTEYGNDPAAIRDYAQMAESLGFTHIVAYDHVLGANPERPGGWKGPYTHESAFHEPFVLFSFMAAHTTTIQFVPGVIILPQRQTALVAKQAATLDVLSKGRLRLGVGLGWNEVEYAALGQDFHTRGRRIEEQVALMRQLWTQPLVTFNGKWHTLPDVGLKPLPVQRPIPIWFGGSVEAAVKRLARLADGWLLTYRSLDQARPMLEKLDQFLAEAGRSRDSFGLEPRLVYGDGDPESWAKEIEAWKAFRPTHLSFNTMGKGFDRPEAHMKAVREFAKAAFG
ncbi:MAG TPA: LLM class F420-dependent oxidoreductase [Anaerolineales bacterium]|nr:LLM class F420-dependent oxidoreductase [Anaerolineales bacterium]